MVWVWPRPGLLVWSEQLGGYFPSAGADVLYTRNVSRRVQSGDLLLSDPGATPPSPPRIGGGNVLPSVVSVQTLRSFGGSFHGQTVLSVGRDLALDSAPRPFVWDANSSDADNGGSVFSAGGATGRWKAKVERSVNVKDFGAKGDGSADDTASIQAAASAAGAGGSIYFPSGVYKTTSTITLNNVGIVGDAVRSNNAATGGVEIAYYGTGYALYLISTSGQSWKRFRVKSYAANQSGVCVTGETPTIENVRIVEFSGVSLRIGTGSLSTVVPAPAGAGATGCYYAQIRNVQCDAQTVTLANALRGVFIDGAFPSANANALHGVVVRGRFDIPFDIGGTSNTLYDGNCELSAAVAMPTAAYKISGTNVRIVNPYYEVAVGTYLYWFTPTSFACEVRGQHLQILTAVQPKTLDEGWANNVRVLPIGYNYAGSQVNESRQNLVPNSHFRSWDSSGGKPWGWRVNLGTWTRAAGTRGAPYVVKTTVSESRAHLACSISDAGAFGLDQVTLADLRGRTVVASVWCKSSVPSLGNMKINGASVGAVGNCTHSGSGNWELLTAIAKIDAAATDVQIQLRSDNDGSNKTGDVEFSEPCMFFGVELSKEEPRPLLDVNAQLFGPFSFAPFATFADGDATPSVADGNCFTSAMSSPTTITSFDDARSGQPLFVQPTNGNTTIANNANIATTTGADKTLSAGVIYRFIFNGTKCVEW